MVTRRQKTARERDGERARPAAAARSAQETRRLSCGHFGDNQGPNEGNLNSNLWRLEP